MKTLDEKAAEYAAISIIEEVEEKAVNKILRDYEK